VTGVTVKMSLRHRIVHSEALSVEHGREGLITVKRESKDLRGSQWTSLRLHRR
jgi:hypothetical protein